METTLANYEDLRTVKQLVAEAPFLTEHMLRWYIFHAHTNGLAPAIVKISNRIYIDRHAFQLWIDRHRLAPAA